MSPLFLFGADGLLAESESIERRVTAIAEDVTAAQGLELVEVRLAGGSQGGHVRVFVDRPGGVQIDELQTVSREISALLDATDPIPGRYRLEVSSPGLDRPLRVEADFRRVTGRLISLEATQPGAALRRLRGRVVSVASGLLTLAVDTDAEPVSLPLADVTSARAEVEIPRGRPRERKNRKTRKAHG